MLLKSITDCPRDTRQPPNAPASRWMIRRRLLNWRRPSLPALFLVVITTLVWEKEEGGRGQGMGKDILKRFLMPLQTVGRVSTIKLKTPRIINVEGTTNCEKRRLTSLGPMAGRRGRAVVVVGVGCGRQVTATAPHLSLKHEY